MMAAALLAALTLGAYAQTNETAEAKDKSLFTKGENSVTLAAQSSYVDSDVDTEWGLAIGVERGLTDNLALGAAAVLNNWGEGSFIDEALIEVKFALPLRLPIKPYVFAHGGYAWEDVETAFAGAGLGAELAFKSGFGIFADIGYRVYDSAPVDADGYMIRAGVRLRL